MAFKKTGTPAKVDGVYCSCGGEIDTDTRKCKQCGKEYKGPLAFQKEQEKNKSDQK